MTVTEVAEQTPLQATIQTLQRATEEKRSEADRVARLIGYAVMQHPEQDHTTLIQELRVADAVAKAFAQCLQIAVGFNSGMLIAAPLSS